jgi:hypothetical protein
MATLAEVKKLAESPQLTTQQKAQVGECVRQLESIAAKPEAQGINPAVWQMIFAVLQQLLQIFLHPTPTPAPAQQPGKK